MRHRASAILIVAKGTAWVLLAFVISVVMPTAAHACRQEPEWCVCIDRCQDSYWKCRQTFPGSYCIVQLDRCQRVQCNGEIDPEPDPDDPPEVDPTIVSTPRAPVVTSPKIEWRSGKAVVASTADVPLLFGLRLPEDSR
jgi:hypothetical protein